MAIFQEDDPEAWRAKLWDYVDTFSEVGLGGDRLQDMYTALKEEGPPVAGGSGSP